MNGLELTPPAETVFSETLHRLAAPLGIIRRRFGLSEDAGEDVTQEVALRFLQSSNPVRSPAGFILTAYRNECVRHLRKRTASGERNLAYLQDLSIATAEAQESAARLDEVLIALPSLGSRDRKWIVDRFFTGVSTKALAVRLGVRETSVGRSIYRAVARLRGLVRTTPP